jgi:hypothetical protein
LAKFIQPNFAAGEVSPAVAANVGLSKRAIAVERAENFFVRVSGGMESRPGMRFIAEAKGTGTTRLIPFEFNTEQTYVLELGDQYMRFYTYGGQILSGGSPYEISTPYLAADLFELEFAQSGDVMTIVHPEYAPRELVRITNTNWTLTEIEFEPSQAAPTGLAITEIKTGSGNILRYKVTANNADTFEESLAGLSGTTIAITGATQADPVVITTGAAHGLQYGDEILIESVVGMTELNDRRFLVLDAPTTTTIELMSVSREPINSTGYTAYTSGGTVRPAFIEVDTHVAPWDLEVSWNAAAGADSYNIYREEQGLYSFIGRTDRLEFQDNFIDADVSDTAPVAANPFEEGAGFWPSTTGFFQQRQIYANSDTFPNRFWMTQTGVFYNFATSSPLRDDDAIIATLAARRINEIRHIIPLSDLVILTSGAEFRIKGAGDNAFTPSTINIKPQSYYGSTALRPIVAGDVALYLSPGNFVRELAYEFAADKFTGRDITVLARHLLDYSEIVDWGFAPSPYDLIWLIRDDGTALVLTYQNEQEVYAWTRATTQGDFKSVAVVREGDIDVPYFLVRRVIDGTVKQFIERLDDRQFEDLQDAFCVDCGLTLDDPITITGMTAADPVVVTAPAHGLSNGDVVDIADVFEVSTSNTRREVPSSDYTGTGFTIANVTTNTFELQNAGADYDGSGFAAYSSGGVVRKAVTTISGLAHLEGAEVVAAANGYAETGLTVSSGSVTLSTPASRVHVGLPFTCQVITLPISTYGSRDVVDKRAMNISRLTVQVERTMGMWTGPTPDQMREAKFGLPALYGQPLPMVTEDIDVTLKADWGKKKQVVIEQRSPLPLSVLSITPDVSVGGN